MNAAQGQTAESRKTAESGKIVLEVEGLETRFHTRRGVVRAVDGLSYALARGETLGVVGESGSGKSVTALSIMRLVPSPPGFIVGGEVILDGENLLDLSERLKRGAYRAKPVRRVSPKGCLYRDMVIWF